MLSDDQLLRIDRATVAVVGHVTNAGRPNAFAVTPYVVDGRLLVTSTLAYVAKGEALRRDPRITLTAGGISVSGTAAVELDTSPTFFDRAVRHQELAKYPPARSLLSLPGHRRLLPWYVGRIAIWIEPTTAVEQPTGDEATLTVLDADGRLTTTSVARPSDLDADAIHVGPAPNGPAILLVHEEDTTMRDLRQLVRRGEVTGGVLMVDRRRGSLQSRSPTTLDELRSLRSLARSARANRDRLVGWPPVGSTPGRP